MRGKEKRKEKGKTTESNQETAAVCVPLYLWVSMVKLELFHVVQCIRLRKYVDLSH
jgi:hypothetical protein